MKRQLSSIDLSYLEKEFFSLEDSRVDKIYQPSKELIIFSFYKANEGKKMLQINVGQSIFITDKKDESETLGFGMLLRKYLDGVFLIGVEQLQPERILKLTFKSKEITYFLYVEFIGKGNVILTDSNDIIINSLEHQEFKDRKIGPKEKYVYPKSKFNLFDLKEEELLFVLKNSKKESIVTCLATELGLGGLYSEEVCTLSGVNKNIKPMDVSSRFILKTIQGIIARDIEPLVYFEDSKLIDFSPFKLDFYSSKDSKNLPTLSDAVYFFYSQFKEVKESEFDKKLKGLQRIIDEQNAKIEEMKKEEIELREKGEFIYHNYSEIKEIIDEIMKASKKFSWKEIKEKLKGHKKIKDLNEKDRKIVVEF